MIDEHPKAVSEAISKVMGAVGYLQKKGTNQFHNYKFTAVGDLLAKVQPAMVEAGLVIAQSETAHELIAEGSVMTATYEFTLSHKDGEEWAYRPRHTGMAGARNSKGGFDDKALNKCHTAARKYFLLALFQIPTGDIADPDEEEDKPTAVTAVTPQRREPERRSEPAEKPPSAVAAFLKGKSLSIVVPGAKVGKPDYTAWGNSLWKAVGACEDVRTLERLWADNSDQLIACKKVDQALHDEVEKSADLRRYDLSQPQTTTLAAE